MTTFRQSGHPRIFTWPTDTPANRIDLSRDCLSFEARRGLDQPSGSFSVDLLPRTSDQGQDPADLARISYLYKTLAVNSPISIGFDEDGGIVFGFIRQIRRITNAAGPQPLRGLRLICEDLGCALTQDSIIYSGLNGVGAATMKTKIAAALGPDSPLLIPFAGVEGVFGPKAGRDATPTFLGARVEDAVRFILDNSTTLQIPLLQRAFGGTGQIGAYILTDYSVTTWNEGRIWSSAPSTYQGSIWGFITSILDRDFYEVFLDYLPWPGASGIPKLRLVVRPKPFDEPSMIFAPVFEETGLTWDALRTFVDGKDWHEIERAEIIAQDLGISDSDVVSYYQVVSQHDLIGNERNLADGLAYPLIDTWAAKKYGLRTYNARLTLLGANIRAKSADVQGQTAGTEGLVGIERIEQEQAAAADFSSKLFSEAHEFRNRLFNWYRLNGYLETGSLTVFGRDAYRPGDRVRLAWQEAPRGDEMGMIYYVVAVAWNWRFGAPYTCSLQLTRGHNAGMVQAIRAEILADAPAINPLHYVEA